MPWSVLTNLIHLQSSSFRGQLTVPLKGCTVCPGPTYRDLPRVLFHLNYLEVEGLGPLRREPDFIRKASVRSSSGMLVSGSASSR